MFHSKHVSLKSPVGVSLDPTGLLWSLPCSLFFAAHAFLPHSLATFLRLTRFCRTLVRPFCGSHVCLAPSCDFFAAHAFLPHSRATFLQLTRFSHTLVRLFCGSAALSCDFFAAHTFLSHSRATFFCGSHVSPSYLPLQRLRAQRRVRPDGPAEAGRVQGRRAHHGGGAGEGQVAAGHPGQGLRHRLRAPARAHLPGHDLRPSAH